MRPSGKSFPFVRACACAAGGKVGMHLKCRSAAFPFSLRLKRLSLFPLRKKLSLSPLAKVSSSEFKGVQVSSSEFK